MINLLPPKYALSIRFGRRNAALRKWLIGICLATLGLIFIYGLTWLYLDSQAGSSSGNSQEIKSQLEAQNLTQVQKDADEISSQIKLINQVLVREIRFSELIQEIGKIMPPGAVLSGLNLENNISGSVDLTVNALDYEAAARVAANLGDPQNKLFSTVDIETVNCVSGDTVYKCTAAYTALFASDAKQRFINVAEGGN